MTLAARISDRAARFGMPISVEIAERQAAYLSLLERWNRRINLTALPLSPPSDSAVDRLIIESLVLFGHMTKRPATTLDIGSGAGSPAIPFKLMCPSTELVMVEARHRRAAFLREAVRVLDLKEVAVENLVFGSRVLSRKFDLITVRAVSMQELLLPTLDSLEAEGELALFGAASNPNAIAGLNRRSVPLPGGSLHLFTRSAVC